MLRVPRHRRVQPHRLAQRRVEDAHPPVVVEVEPLALAVVSAFFPRAAGAARRGDLVEHLGLDAAVAHEEPEEPGERRRGGVAAGHDEADHHVADRLVGVPAFDHPRQQVAPRAAAAADAIAVDQEERALLPPAPDEPHHGLMDHPDLLPQPPLRPGVERALHLPHGGHGRRASPGDDPRRRVERRGQPRRRQCRVEASRVNAERDPADDVEREPPEHVLHVHHPAAARRRGERRDEAVPRLGLEHGDLEVPERARGELVADELALGVPELAVDVEDAHAEQVAEHVGERLPLGVVGEPRPEDVLDVRRVRRHHRAPRAQPVNDDRLRRRRRQHLRVPVQQPPPVAVERHQAPDHRVAPRPPPAMAARRSTGR
ncbi:Os11g0482901 [Oryza sativa Japonica Group]|uniref:Os11g0482901 protein n=1 Tax=Oryza sativa subsp. japonica TaxID=39947 RepID=A0A0N7KSX7_ORYSJ|nr:hypothetical protein EE612_055575 [Oryza sativa]BAT14050.1 Os11g0482901 [Oryza sativa Japonica Group]